jgi:hypothetical protein
MADKKIENLPSSRQTTIVIGTDWNFNGLASAANRIGKQSDMQSNDADGTERFHCIEILLKVRLNTGTTPTGNTAVYVHELRGDGTNRTDGAAATEGTLTQKNAPILGILRVGASPSAGDYLYGHFQIWYPGIEWGLMLWHDTGQALSSTAGDHDCGWVGKLPNIEG